jgi:hypothetical protein
MKKNDWLLIISVLIYSYLFYNQDFGINYLLFTIVLTAAQCIKDPSVVKSRQWLASTAGALLSGICVLMYGNGLSVFANILSLSMASVYSVTRESSLIFTILFSLYSYVFSVFLKFMNYMEREQTEVSHKVTGYPKFLVTLVPLVIALIFFLMYREGNPLFKEATTFNLDFFTFGWFRFVVAGAFLLYGFYNVKTILPVQIFDTVVSDRLHNRPQSEGEGFFSVVNENTSGIILLSLLNLMLFTVNLLDFSFIFITHRLPAGITYTDFVHQGVYTLIASIVFAITIIMYYLRGGLNFYKDNKWIKLLAYAWIVQNIFLVLSTCAKNHIYINEFGLTYKRTGVYVYLILTLIGLVTTILKIWKVKSNWFLFRKNSWAFYCVLILSVFVNWDLFITKYNISYSKTLDREYILSLSDSVLPDLAKATANDDELQKSITDVHKIIETRKKYFIQNYNSSDWQSFNFENKRIYENLRK